MTGVPRVNGEDCTLVITGFGEGEGVTLVVTGDGDVTPPKNVTDCWTVTGLASVTSTVIVSTGVLSGLAVVVMIDIGGNTALSVTAPSTTSLPCLSS